MSKEDILPFARGQTAADGALTPASGDYDHLAGLEYTIDNDQHDGDVTLKCLVNGASALTVERRFVKTGTGAEQFARKEAAWNDVAGGIAWPLDDAYTVGDTIAAYDAFWVVKRGYCDVKLEASSVSLGQGDAIASDASGYVNGAAAAAGETALGRIDQANTTTVTADTMYINVPDAPAEAAG